MLGVSTTQELSHELSQESGRNDNDDGRMNRIVWGNKSRKFEFPWASGANDVASNFLGERKIPIIVVQ